jgi:hypothetical protein
MALEYPDFVDAMRRGRVIRESLTPCVDDKRWDWIIPCFDFREYPIISDVETSEKLRERARELMRQNAFHLPSNPVVYMYSSTEADATYIHRVT